MIETQIRFLAPASEVSLRRYIMPGAVDRRHCLSAWAPRSANGIKRDTYVTPYSKKKFSSCGCYFLNKINLGA